jgi:hypothetical protein
MPKLRPGCFVLALFSLLFATFTVPAFADSQVRIVRLSDIQGDVMIDRANGNGYQRAFVNLPITQGVKVQTREDGLAEVEFEDGGTLRLSPKTTVEFTQLSLRDSGAKVSTVELRDGMVYVSFSGKNSDQLSLNFGQESVSLTQPAHFRVEMSDNGSARLAVFDGNVQVQSPSGMVEVAKKHQVSFENGTQTVAKLEKYPLDDVDKRQDEYHERYLAKSGNGISPFSYGTSDLYYYGSFFGVPGYGTVWQPYLAGASWDPFMDGMWLYSAGYGYGWVSSYPWGWTPYHYGQWVFLPQYGWAWQPSGSWQGWNNSPRLLNPPQRFTMPHPPASPGRTVLVRRGPTTVMQAGSGERIISRGSAGIGIPRGSVRNLNRVSDQVEKHGAVMLRSVPTRTMSAQPASGSPSASRNVGPPTSRSPRPETSSPMQNSGPRMGSGMGGGGMGPRSSPGPRSGRPR